MSQDMPPELAARGAVPVTPEARAAHGLPEPVFHFARGIVAREERVRAGLTIAKHVHDYDHLSMLGSGRVRLTVAGKTTEIDASKGAVCLTIKAGQVHVIEALTDVVWFCIHADPADKHEDGRAP